MARPLHRRGQSTGAQNTDGGKAAPEAYRKATPMESTESPAIKLEKDNQPDTHGAKSVDGMTARV